MQKLTLRQLFANRRGLALQLVIALYLFIRAGELIFFPYFLERAENSYSTFLFVLKIAFYLVIYLLIILEPKLGPYVKIDTLFKPRKSTKKVKIYDEKEDINYIDDLYETPLSTINAAAYKQLANKFAVKQPLDNQTLIAETTALLNDPAAKTAAEAASATTTVAPYLSDYLASFPTVLLAVAVFAISGLLSTLTLGLENVPFILLLAYALYHLYTYYYVHNRKFFIKNEVRDTDTDLTFDNLRFLPLLALLFLLLAVVAHAVSNGLYLYARAASLNAPNFDYGIFNQIISSITRTATPVITLERNRVLSHFAVHFSPILYLFAPLYAMLPKIFTINVTQIVPVLLALIPLNAFMKLKKISALTRYLILAIYVVSPGQIFSSHYDFHENCFLSFAVITLFYFMEKHSRVGIAISTLILLAVKEDSFIYVVAIALYYFYSASKQGKLEQVRTSIIVLLFAVIYFITTSNLMSFYGLGTMINTRFSNITPQNTSGIMELLKALFTRPYFVIREIFASDKLNYIYLSLFTCGCSVFWSRNYHANFLLLPLVFINLLSSWQYQYNIDFQYHYGSHALLIIILILSLHSFSSFAASKQTVPAAKLNPLDACVQKLKLKLKLPHNNAVAPPRVTPALFTLILVVTLFSMTFYSSNKLRSNLLYAQDYLLPKVETALQMDAAVNTLDKSKVYMTTSFMASAFRDFPQVYDLDSANENFDYSMINYLVLDNRSKYSAQLQEKIDKLLAEQHFVQIAAPDANLLLYEKAA